MKIPELINPLLAEETGWHIGDGTMNYYSNKNKLRGKYCLRGHIRDDVKHYNNRIKPIFKELYGINVSLRYMHKTRVYGFELWSDELVKFKNKIIGLPLGKKGEIKIPENLLENKDLLISVIRGIFDTDGCLYLEKKRGRLYPRIKITTISKSLAKQLKEKINELGIRATLYVEKKKPKNWNDLNVVEIRGKEEAAKWFNLINPQNPKFIDKYNYFLSN